MMNKLENNEALKRVWLWKEEIHNDVKNLSIRERFKEIHKMAEKAKSEMLILI